MDSRNNNAGMYRRYHTSLHSAGGYKYAEFEKYATSV